MIVDIEEDLNGFWRLGLSKVRKRYCAAARGILYPANSPTALNNGQRWLPRDYTDLHKQVVDLRDSTIKRDQSRE